MATEPSSLANLYQDHEDVAKLFANIVYNIAKHSHDFNQAHYLAHELHLCEAYCLLWQNAETGEVEGRKFGVQLKICTMAALFIDLCAASLIELTKEGGIGSPRFRVNETKECDSDLLEIAIFKSVRQAQRNKSTLWRWLLRAAETECVETTFDSLVARGILSEKSGLLTKRFVTVNPQPELTLEREIKEIASGNQTPDSYMLALLVLARESDRLFLCKDPILKKHFSSAEYIGAKKNLDAVLAAALLVG